MSSSPSPPRPRSNRLAWDRYLKGHDRNNPPPFAVPARTPSLEGLPPTWIGVGFDVVGADTPQAKAFLASQMDMVRARLAELGWTRESGSE